SGLLLALFLAPQAEAQNRFGFIGGVNFADLEVSPTVTGVQGHLFAMGGAFADIAVLPEFFIEAQFRLNQKGADLSKVQGVAPVDINIALRYVELPLYLKW